MKLKDYLTEEKMSYKALMKKIDDGMAEVDAWQRDGKHALVRFYTKDGRSKREMVEITGTPKDFEM